MNMNGSKQAAVGRTSTARSLPALVFAVVLALVATGCGGDSGEVTTTAVAGSPVAHGQQLAGESCSGCHGQNFEGVTGLGPALADTGFIRDHTDDDLIDFIKEGRSMDDSDNETGIAMPPYGGNPRLNEDDLVDIVLFLRTLQ
jgi:mono/diheme cytochrome c family protein